MLDHPDVSWRSLRFRLKYTPRFWGFPKWITRPLGWDLRLGFLEVIYRVEE